MTYGKISQKQSEILEYMKNEILNRGFPPSVSCLLYTSPSPRD